MKTGMNLLLWTGHVTAEHYPLLAKLKAAESELDKLAKSLEMDLSNQVLTEYTESLKTSLGANINEAELKRALGITEQ